MQELSGIEKGWLGNGQGEKVVDLAILRARQLIVMRADLADLFRIFPTEEGGILLEFDKDSWSFAVEIMPNGSVEIDGSSKDGGVFELQSFDGLSKNFFETFDKMTSVVLNNQN